MTKLHNILGSLFALLSTMAMAQQTPAPTQSKVITITGGTAHIGNGQVIENAVLVLENGKITTIAVGNELNLKPQGTVINAKGKHIYPGFIATNTTLGLVEVGAVRPSNDDDEIGDMIPHIRALIAYNAESKVVESMRPNGVLMAQTRPLGGTISGTSSVVQLDAWNWEDAAYKADDGVWLSWPNSMTRGRWWLGEEPGFKPNKNYVKDIDEVKTFIADAAAYARGNTDQNLAFEAMKGIFEGTQNLYVSANGEREIRDIINFKRDMGIKNLVLVGAYEAPQVAKELANAKIPVILQRVQETPSIADHDYDYNYKFAIDLVNAGVTVALGYDGEYWQVRNLPFYAGQITGQGMSDAEALKLITLNPALILGIDKQTGTLEQGKDATLFISDGNALDMRTNIISRAFIQGRDISLESHQTKLYKRYNAKAQEGQ
jgi:hypothetical protein